jgi:hemolysin activation/secretion protein
MQAVARSSQHPQRGARLYSAAICLLLVPAALFAEAAKDPDAFSSGPSLGLISATPTLSSSAAVVGSINILNGSIFDLHDPEENSLFYRLANKMHATTRPAVIRQQLLFESGDQLFNRDLEESERILRSNRYIQDAKIERVPNKAGVVDINVRTTDVWTLVPKISLSRSGGENKTGIGIKEMNLLGSGIDIEASYKSNVDRDSTIIKFADRNLGSSWYGLSAAYANNSDGHVYQVELGKPFYSLDSTSALGISFLDSEQIDSLYDRGEVMAEYRRQARSYEVFKGWSGGLKNDWARRYTAGLAYDEHRFSEVEFSTAPLSILPENRKLAYPFVGVEVLQDKFEKAKNYEQINRTEDRYLGTRLGVRIGFASTSFGSDRDAWILNASAQTGFGDSQSDSLILASNIASRLEDDGLRNTLIGVSAKYYRRQSESRLFYASLSSSYGRNLDIDNQLLLGGDSGLRGYPLRYQTGDKSALLTLEQRFFTDWYPMRLFRVGGALFFDAGRTWGRSSVSDRPNELLRDVGFGLRIGNSRSGQGRMAHIDLAFPLDGDSGIKSVQLLLQTRKSF